MSLIQNLINIRMGRETWIYSFDQKKARNNLLPYLENKSSIKNSFKQHIEERNNKLKRSHYDSYKIIETISKDINLILTEELFDIITFIYRELRSGSLLDNITDWNKREEIELATYSKYGLNLLYELPTKTVCYSYMFQYGTYTSSFPIPAKRFNGDDGMNISSYDFLKFNDYMILMMKNIIDSGIDEDIYHYNEFNDEYKVVIHETVKNYNKNSILNKLVLDELEFLKPFWEEKKGGPHENTIWRAPEFLYKSIEMKLAINPKINTRIVILDSI